MNDCEHCYEGVIRAYLWPEDQSGEYETPCHICPQGQVLQSMMDALGEDLGPL